MKEQTDMFQERYKVMSKQEVMRQYEQDHDEFLEAVHLVPDSQWGDPILDHWTMKEVLDHIASWNLETMRSIQAVMRGGIPWFFDHQELVDKFNHEQIEKKKNMTTQEVFEEIETNHRTLIGFLESLPNASFHQSYGRMWHGEAVTPALICSYRHYATHRGDILRYLEKTKAV